MQVARGATGEILRSRHCQEIRVSICTIKVYSSFIYIYIYVYIYVYIFSIIKINIIYLY